MLTPKPRKDFYGANPEVMNKKYFDGESLNPLECLELYPMLCLFIHHLQQPKMSSETSWSRWWADLNDTVFRSHPLL